ncbi:hypothetical protein [uncultured Pseudodesulfovibrio sp.]|uniref:hypothetical protein n=1 Tax=uncultured Pseudodesulfovibrio sp. TaxID=2035858 RepID=UPI0029C96111|nr:hypothetical protein [uncultured Pseudodesulfovibrio sp.]
MSDVINYDRSRIAFDFLYMHRMVRSLGSELSILRNGEAEIAEWLAAPNNHASYAHVENMLKTYGFELVHVTDNEMDGIPLGGFCYFILKVAEKDLPPWMTTQSLLDCVGIRGDLQPDKRRWAHLIWSMLLGLLYTRNNRPTSSVYDYNKAWFTLAELEEVVSEEIKKYRHTPVDGRSRSMTLLLKSTEPKKIKSRVKSAIIFLEKIGYISHSKSNKNEYVQTLVMAKEVALNERSGFSHIVNEDLITTGNVANQLDAIYTNR